MNQITGLIDQGHQVDIYAEAPEQGSKAHAEVARYHLLESTCYWRYDMRFFSAHISVFRACLRQPNIAKWALRMSRYGRIFSMSELLLCGTVFSSFMQREYDIIHCQFATCGLLGMYLKDAGLLKGSLVVSFRGYDISRMLQRFGRHIYDTLFQVGDLFLPNCDYFKSRLMSLGCDEKKIIVHHSGINAEKFPLRKDRASVGETIRISTVGRLIEKKGIVYALHAVAGILRKGHKVTFTLAGRGPLKAQLVELAKKLKIERNLRFLGALSSDEVVELLHHTDIFLAPSVTGEDGDQEGTPVVLMEAMAMGIPVISTLHSGIPELVRDNESGFLVPEKDVEGMCVKLFLLMEDPELRLKMGTRAREAVMKNYDINKLNNRLAQIYKDISLLQ